MIVLVVLAVGGFMLLKMGSAADASSSPIISEGHVTRGAWGLPDVDSANDASGFDSAYDEAYEKASGATGVPFALLKAHGWRESKFDPQAYHYDNDVSGASYGLNQVEWNHNDRFAKYGYPDEVLGADGGELYKPEINAMISALIIKDNIGWLMKSTSMQGLRDVINAYNAGCAETKRAAPNHYVDDVLMAYGQILGRPVTL